MNEVFIRTKSLSGWIADKYFKNVDEVSLEDFIDKFEDIVSDLENVQERFDDFKEDVKENYKPIPPAEHVCYDDDYI